MLKAILIVWIGNLDQQVMTITTFDNLEECGIAREIVREKIETYRLLGSSDILTCAELKE